MCRAALFVAFTSIGVACALLLGGCGGTGYIRGDGVPIYDAAMAGYCARNPTSPLCNGGRTP